MIPFSRFVDSRAQYTPMAKASSAIHPPPSCRMASDGAAPERLSKRRRMAVWTRLNVDGILDCGAAEAVPAKGSSWIQAHRLLLARKRHGGTAHRQSAGGLLRRLYHPV